ncbi:MAG: hypothetical protein M0004_03210 [Actinomycetota bacterium]|nr:hypothetical protein [Actinomycetota bacterium]
MIRLVSFYSGRGVGSAGGRAPISALGHEVDGVACTGVAAPARLALASFLHCRMSLAIIYEKQSSPIAKPD